MNEGVKTKGYRTGKLDFEWPAQVNQRLVAGGYNAILSLAQRVNMTPLEKPLQKVVVYLDPSEFRSTWLGNKAIYRTRMALADGGKGERRLRR